MPACSMPPPLRVYSDGLEALCWLETTPVPAAVPASASQGKVESSDVVVTVEEVRLSFRGGGPLWRGQEVEVLKGINLELRRGATLGLVGESGCGKSTLARVIAGLIPMTAGRVTLLGQDISTLDTAAWQALRRQVQLVFQNPYGALNPRRRIGAIIGDPFRIHGIASGPERKAEVQRLMELVGLNPEHYNRFPSEFSGGQRQRIGIARALALNPALIIYDEPVSALDVSIQAQILNLMRSLQEQLGLTYLFISHDLAVVRHVCDHVAVMEAGRIVEMADTETLYAAPQHPYTRTLLAASVSPPPRHPVAGRRLVTSVATELA
jgi:peptide/nickel transport system ATP-binding protein